MIGAYLIRRARKAYTCTEASYHTIQPGERYLYGACPPWHDFARNTRKWWIIRACLRCAEHYHLHNSDTRKQLEEDNGH